MTEQTNQPAPQNNSSKPQPATRKEVFAPLATYGVVAIGIVAIIITTTIMLNKELNTIERDVNRLESELASKNEADVAAQTTPPNTLAATEPGAAGASIPAGSDKAGETKPVAAADKVKEHAPSFARQNIAAGTSRNTTPVEASNPPAGADTSMVQADAAASATAAVNPPSLTDMEQIRNRLKQRISEQQALMQQQESRQLQQYQAAMDRQIAMLRQQIEHTRELIARIEQRNQQNYAMRAARLEQQRQQRERFMDAMVDRI